MVMINMSITNDMYLSSADLLGQLMLLLQVLPLLYRGVAHAVGPQQWWTDNSKAVSLMLDEIFIFYRE